LFVPHAKSIRRAARLPRKRTNKAVKAVTGVTALHINWLRQPELAGAAALTTRRAGFNPIAITFNPIAAGSKVIACGPQPHRHGLEPHRGWP
jgi:hypothetical protein